MILTRPGRPLPCFVQGFVVAVPDVAWIPPFPSPCLASSYGVSQPTLCQLSTAAEFAGTFAGILRPRTGDTGKTGEVLVVGAPDEAAGFGNLRQVYLGRRCQDPAFPHVAATGPSSLHLDI